ncbi:chitobiosyldiphosphodolichol beta-mannosyltransferase, partial [Aureobasidium melanogenum]
MDELPLIESGGHPARSWLSSLFWTILLPIAVTLSTLVTAFILTIPSPYDPQHNHPVDEASFSDDDKQNEHSGYAYYAKNPGATNDASVTVLVLGDIGRSPRMQYHVASIAAHGGRVSLIGYLESELLPEIRNNRFVTVIPLAPPPEALRNANKILFPIIAPLKVLWQIGTVWHACGYRTKATKWMLVQNPPSIPTLAIAQAMCFIRHTRLIIDWHNFGYTILALKLGNKHPLVQISEMYERYVARAANAHFSVTNAMARVLKQRFGVEATPLHDRPAAQFQPLNPTQRSEFLHRCPETAHYAKHLDHGSYKLLVSSTSWTADEDFSILLDALVAYSATVSMATHHSYPKILAIITGKGPLKDHYLSKISTLTKEKKLVNVKILTAWLSNADYASLLASADLGVSLHTSSSGVDLPMKVVDMFGTGLPVVGWSRFEAWKELVHEGVNGFGFSSADGLETLLEELFGSKGARTLAAIRKGAMQECERRWADEWFPVAGKLLGLKRGDEGEHGVESKVV